MLDFLNFLINQEMIRIRDRQFDLKHAMGETQRSHFTTNPYQSVMLGQHPKIVMVEKLIHNDSKSKALALLHLEEAAR